MPDVNKTFAGTSLYPPQPSSSVRGFPFPRTPEPDTALGQESHRPCWAMGGPISTSASDDYFQRPTSSMSTASDWSDDSQCSGSRRSHLSHSEDGSCTSPESDAEDPFQFSSLSKANPVCLNAPVDFNLLNQKLRSKTRVDAPWSKAMSDHLWSTYVLYLQDPTVTPFRANGVPPEGVCYRVAREAKRSWKGPQSSSVTRRSRMFPMASSQVSDKSGSITPTGEGSTKLYAQWPHSSGATRNHLRELCRKETSAVQRHRHFQSRSATPFTRARSFDNAGPRASMFNTKDIALSLATSTSTTMQPDGPLASLASEDSVPLPNFELSISSPSSPIPAVEPVQTQPLAVNIEEQRCRRLGSPFTARTYGPSSSQLHRRPHAPRHLSDNSASRLRSPLRFGNPRSLQNTQKRRAQHPLEDELSPSGAVLRPGILDKKLFGTPLGGSRRRVRTRGFSLGDEALHQGLPGLFSQPPPDSDLANRLGLPTNESQPQESSSAAPSLLPAPELVPRLGSPFTEVGPSQTFPRRLFADSKATIKRGAYATVHQTRHSIDSYDLGPSTHQTRLERLDSKLKEMREREAAAKM